MRAHARGARRSRAQLLESPADLEINGHPLVSLNGAFVVIVSYCMYYIYLDRPFGLAWTVIAAPTLYLFANAFFAAVGRELAWKYAVAIHISSWAAQVRRRVRRGGARDTSRRERRCVPRGAREIGATNACATAQRRRSRMVLALYQLCTRLLVLAQR